MNEFTSGFWSAYIAILTVVSILACGVRGLDLGVAIKIDDGLERAYVPILLTILRRLNVLSEAESVALASYTDTRLFNHARLHVGHIDVTFEGP